MFEGDAYAGASELPAFNISSLLDAEITILCFEQLILNVFLG